MLRFDLQTLMNDSDLTVKDICEATGLSRTTIYNLLNKENNIKALQLETLSKISALFAIPIDELFIKPSFSYEIFFEDDIEPLTPFNGFFYIVPTKVFYNGILILDYFILIHLDRELGKDILAYSYMDDNTLFLLANNLKSSYFPNIDPNKTKKMNRIFKTTNKSEFEESLLFFLNNNPIARKKIKSENKVVLKKQEKPTHFSLLKKFE